MRGIVGVLLCAASPAFAASPRLDVGVGLMTAPRATSSQTGPAVGLAGSVPLTATFQLRLESLAAPFGESNAVVRLSRWEWRTALTADVVTSRQSVALRLGVGPALVVQPVRVAGDTTYGGTRLRVGGRGHLGLSGPIRDALGWRVGVGTLLSADRVGWDALVGLTLTPASR